MVNCQVVRPFAATARVTSRSCSTLLERRLTDFGADEPFAKVPAKLKEHYGIELPLHLARRTSSTRAHSSSETGGFDRQGQAFESRWVRGAS